jgi:hypothetical protein
MSMRTPFTSAGLLAVGLLLTAHLATPVAQQPPAARPASTTTQQPVGSGAAGLAEIRIDRLVDRVWVAEASSAAPAGALFVFLSDNVLVRSANGKPPSLGTWAEDATGLVITEKGITSKVEVLELTAERLRLRVNGKAPVEMAFTPAIRPPAPTPAVASPADSGAATAGPAAPLMPVGMAFRCGADSLRVAFEDNKAYITWPDGTAVALPETKSPETTNTRRLYSDGQLRVVEDTSESFTRVLFARPGFRPRACTPAR